MHSSRPIAEATPHGRALRADLLAFAALLRLLLTHHLLVTLGELRFLAVAVLGGIGLHDGMDLFVVHHAPDQERLTDGEQVGQQVVVAQAAGIAVEPQKHHHRHHVNHHKLHARHLGLRRGGLLVVDVGESEERHDPSAGRKGSHDRRRRGS